MRQGGALIVEDRIGVGYSARSGRSSYLLALPLVLAVAAMVLLGLMEPRRSPARAAGQSASPTASAAPTETAPGESNENVQTLPPSAEVHHYAGLDQLTVSGLSITSAGLPLEAANGPFAVFGSRVFYVQGNRVMASTFESSADPQVIASLGAGHVIRALQANRDRVGILEESSLGREELCESDCPADSRFLWQVRLFGVDGSWSQLALTFERTLDEEAAGSALFALGDGTWAIAKPRHTAAGSLETTIEVYSDAGQVAWTTSSDGPVRSLMLGGTRLAAVVGDPDPEASLTLAVADADEPLLRSLDTVSTGASMSADGRYLAWDSDTYSDTSSGSCRQLVVLDVGAGTLSSELRCDGSDWASPPQVGSGATGPTAVWLAGGVKAVLAIRSPLFASDVWLEAAGEPVWSTVQEDSVFWASVDDMGLTVSKLDLSAADYRIE